MNYLALVYHSSDAWESMTQVERAEFNRDAERFVSQMTESGALLGQPMVLAHPSAARTLRVRDGVPVMSDGPFAEAKEYLAGGYVFQADSVDRASELVVRDPSARYFSVEVRPIMQMGGSDW